MNPPKNVDLPFFAYGIFKLGEIAYFQIQEFVDRSANAQIQGTLLIRDGLPILDLQGSRSVSGSLLTFQRGTGMDAYQRIANMEPDKQYRWENVTLGEQTANVLAGKKPQKGSKSIEDKQWNSWEDPLFKEALDVVEETLARQEFDERDMKPMFRLQMAYLLLWSSIERYLSLRHHLGHGATAKVAHLAREPAFADGLRQRVQTGREVQSAADPGEKETLDPAKPKSSVDYYYQVRSNMVHRGKGEPHDFDTVRLSLKELLPIFRDVLAAAESVAQTHAGRAL